MDKPNCRKCVYLDRESNLFADWWRCWKTGEELFSPLLIEGKHISFRYIFESCPYYRKAWWRFWIRDERRIR